MTDKWMNKSMKTADFCDCGAEFMRRNLKRFVPLMAVYAILFALYSYTITDTYNIAGLYSLAESTEESAEELAYAPFEMILGTYLGLACAAAASFVGLIITGMIVYVAYTKIMTGCEPSRKYTLKRGLVYALFSELWSAIVGAVLYAAMIVFAIISVQLYNIPRPDGWGYIILIAAIVLLAFVIVLVYFYGRFSMLGPLMIVKNENVFKAAKSSWKLTKKKCFRTLVFIVGAGILVSTITGIVTAMTTIGMLESDLTVRILTAVVNGVASCAEFITPAAFVFYVVYYEGRSGSLAGETELNAFLKERGV